MLQLYHHNISVCSQKVRMVLDEKLLPWESIDVDLKASEQAAPEYLKLNRRGVVPTLLDNGRPVTESTVICEYLEDTCPDTELRPADPVDRAHMRKWAKIPDEGLHIACGSLSFAAAFASQLAAGHTGEELEERLAIMPDKARAARQREILKLRFDAPLVRDAILLHRKVLMEMGERLADNAWLAGDACSLADIGLLPYIERLHRLGLAPMWEDLPGVATWYDRIRIRPSYDSAYTAWPPTGDYDDRLIDMGESAWPQVRTVLEAA